VYIRKENKHRLIDHIQQCETFLLHGVFTLQITFALQYGFYNFKVLYRFLAKKCYIYTTGRDLDQSRSWC